MAADGAVAARAGSPATRGGRKTGQSLKVAHWTGRVWHHPMSALGQKQTFAACPLCAKSGHDSTPYDAG